MPAHQLQVRDAAFQSHAGSIEAWRGHEDLDPGALFQSHAGSIEAVSIEFYDEEEHSVSIPRWFD